MQLQVSASQFNFPSVKPTEGADSLSLSLTSSWSFKGVERLLLIFRDFKLPWATFKILLEGEL